MSKKKAVTEQSLSDRALEELRKALRKQFGQESIRTYDEVRAVPTIPTGILRLDKVLSGGVPQGRMVEFYGDASSGKTTLTLSIMVQAQKMFPDKTCVYIDAEHSLDMVWAAKNGINIKQFDHCEPIYGEDAVEMIEQYLQSGLVSVVALDSVAALLPRVEMKGDVAHANIGNQARLVASALRRINSILVKHPQSVVILINQKRAQIAGGGSFNYEPTKTTGGKALPFYMTTRIGLARLQRINDATGNQIGQIVKVDVVKNKVNTGHGKKLQFQIMEEYGIDVPFELLTWAEKTGRITKAGSWYAINETGEKVQGEVGIKQLIRTKYQDQWIEIAKDSIDVDEVETVEELAEENALE